MRIWAHLCCVFVNVRNLTVSLHVIGHIVDRNCCRCFSDSICEMPSSSASPHGIHPNRYRCHHCPNICLALFICQTLDLRIAFSNFLRSTRLSFASAGEEYILPRQICIRISAILRIIGLLILSLSWMIDLLQRSVFPKPSDRISRLSECQ